MGTVRASELIRSLQRGGRASTLGRAIGELGRIPKTLHLLNFIADSNYRRHILNQLNRGEGRGRLSRKVFYGQRGELRQRYREGQEDQLSALGLVVNALILWTTRYMNAAVNHLHATGTDVKKEDLARLHPSVTSTSTRWVATLHGSGRGLKGRLAAAPHARGSRRRATDRLAQLFVPLLLGVLVSLQLGQETTNYAFHKCIVEGLPREPASVEEGRDD